MKKDIQIPEVKNVHLAVVFEYNDIYKTDDWKINIKPVFLKEIRALFFNIYPNNKQYIIIRNYYRIYLIIYLFLFLFYYLY